MPDLTFGLGPAGTGKTYLAVAKAVECLSRGQVDRIILSRPAVEAGEQIGFLPGDMREKVDPYMRPIYDALQDMLPNNVVEKKMHITGGVGAIHQYEGFGYNYFLPEDGYLESCAGVGLAFWASNMNIAFGNSCYSDVFEKVVYNNIITGVSLSGDSFFYQNPLKSNGGHHRWSNHDCPCCHDPGGGPVSPSPVVKELHPLGPHCGSA